MDQALAVEDTQIRIFGKPDTKIGRRMAVILSKGKDVEIARQRAEKAAAEIVISTEE